MVSLILALAAHVQLGALALAGGLTLPALALLALEAPLLALGRLRARGLPLLCLALLALLRQALLTSRWPACSAVALADGIQWSIALAQHHLLLCLISLQLLCKALLPLLNTFNLVGTPLMLCCVIARQYHVRT